MTEFSIGVLFGMILAGILLLVDKALFGTKEKP